MLFKARSARSGSFAPIATRFEQRKSNSAKNERALLPRSTTDNTRSFGTRPSIPSAYPECSHGGFFNLNHHAVTAHRGRITGTHRLADAVTQKPRGLILHFQDAVQSVRTDALFAGAREIDRLQSLVQRNAHVLENRSDPHRELLLAMAALVKAIADPLFWVRLDLADTV